MRNWLILGVLGALLGACAPAPDIHSPESGYYRQQEAQVLVDLFEEVIAKKTTLTIPHNFERGAELDTIRFTLHLRDSLVTAKSLNDTPVYDMSSSAIENNILTKLNDSIPTTTVIPEKLLPLLKQYSIQLLPRSVQLRFLPYDEAKPEADLIISRISFNRSFTQACFLTQYACGRYCGSKVLLFVRKVNGRWMITRGVGLSVS